MTARPAAARSSSSPPASGSAAVMARIQSRAASCSLRSTLIVPPAAGLRSSSSGKRRFSSLVWWSPSVKLRVKSTIWLDALRVDDPARFDAVRLGLHGADDQQDIVVLVGELTGGTLAHGVLLPGSPTGFPAPQAPTRGRCRRGDAKRGAGRAFESPGRLAPPYGECGRNGAQTPAAARSIAARLRSTSSSVVAQAETLMRMAVRPCQTVPPAPAGAVLLDAPR